MNFPLFFAIFAAVFCSFLVAEAAAADQADVPGVKKLNLTTNVGSKRRGEIFQLTCEYEASKPTREGQNKDQDWELTVAFHNGHTGSGPETRLGEFQQWGNTNMSFHTVQHIEGMNLWPVDGVSSGLQSPKSVYVLPSPDSMWTYSNYWCSLTMKLKGTAASVRFTSKTVTVQPGQN